LGLFIPAQMPYKPGVNLLKELTVKELSV